MFKLHYKLQYSTTAIFQKFMHNIKQYTKKIIDFLSKLQVFENAHRSTPLAMGK